MDWCSAFHRERYFIIWNNERKDGKYSVPSDLFHQKWIYIMTIVAVFRLVRNFSFREWRDNETRRDIEKWQSAPVFCTGCFESDATIRGRIVFALAIIQGLKIRDEVGRLDRRLHCKITHKSKKEKDDIAYTGHVFQCWINFKIMRK